VAASTSEFVPIANAAAFRIGLPLGTSESWPAKARRLSRMSAEPPAPECNPISRKPEFSRKRPMPVMRWIAEAVSAGKPIRFQARPSRLTESPSWVAMKSPLLSA
jgi:hypothetical protein